LRHNTANQIDIGFLYHFNKLAEQIANLSRLFAHKTSNREIIISINIIKKNILNAASQKQVTRRNERNPYRIFAMLDWYPDAVSAVDIWKE
jgi:hypothetical protein